MSETYSQRFRMHTMPKAQCHVHIFMCDDGIQVDLISYSTLVCRARLIGSKLTLECTGVYTRTTSRHINRFTTEFFGKNLYYTCKGIADSGDAMVSTCATDISRFKVTVSDYINNTFPDWNAVKYNWRY